MANEDPLAGLGLNTTPPPAAPKKKTPIGVPKDYVPPVGAGGYVPPPSADRGQGGYTEPGGYQQQLTAYGTAPNSSQYTDGQEWSPLNDPQSIPSLQTALVQAGLLNPKNVRPGVWDSASASAYRAALAFANVSGANVQDALGILIQNKKYGSAASAPGPYALLNPEDARSAYRTAAQNLTGHDPSTNEQQQFAAYYQSQERTAFNQKAVATTGGALTDVSPPSVSTAAEDFVKQQDPQSVMAYGMASRAAEFQQMLGSATGL